MCFTNQLIFSSLFVYNNWLIGFSSVINITKFEIINNPINVIVGITNSKSEEQYYIAQHIANNILGYEGFDVPNQVWNGPNNPGYGYIPFNGLFTNQKEPKFIMNFGGVYSPSGMSMTLGQWNTNIGYGSGQTTEGELRGITKDHYKQINDLTRINSIVDRQNNNKVVTYSGKTNPIVPMPYNNKPDADAVGNVVRNIVKVYETKDPILMQLVNVDTPYINQIAGTTIDNTIQNVESIVIVSLIPTLLIVIFMLAMMIIIEARRLISLLKVMGYSDWKNIWSFMFIYVVVLVLGTLLSIPFVLGINNLIISTMFTIFNIIINPVVNIGIYIAIFMALLLVFALVFMFGLYNLKKTNAVVEVSTH